MYHIPPSQVPMFFFFFWLGKIGKNLLLKGGRGEDGDLLIFIILFLGNFLLSLGDEFFIENLGNFCCLKCKIRPKKLQKKWKNCQTFEKQQN